MRVTKCCCFELRTGCLILLFLFLLGSIYAALSSAGCLPINIISIVIFVIGFVALFKEKSKWLIPSVVWTVIAPILSFLYLIFSGNYENELHKYQISSIEYSTMMFICFVLNLLCALVLWSYYELLMEQKPQAQQQPQISTLDQLQNQTQNPQAKGDFVV